MYNSSEQDSIPSLELLFSLFRCWLLFNFLLWGLFLRFCCGLSILLVLLLFSNILFVILRHFNLLLFNYCWLTSLFLLIFSFCLFSFSSSVWLICISSSASLASSSTSFLIALLMILNFASFGISLFNFSWLFFLLFYFRFNLWTGLNFSRWYFRFFNSEWRFNNFFFFIFKENLFNMLMLNEFFVILLLKFILIIFIVMISLFKLSD